MSAYAKFVAFVSDVNNSDDYGLDHLKLMKEMDVSMDCALLMDYLSTRSYFREEMIPELIRLDKIGNLPSMANLNWENGTFC